MNKIIIPALVIINIILLVLSFTTPAKLLTFSTSSGDVSFTNPYYQIFSWKFSRPLNTSQFKDLSKLIKFTPEIPGKFQLNGETVRFTPDSPLSYGSNYQIKISDRLTDTYAKPLGAEVYQAVTTRPLQFLALSATSQTGLSNLILHTIDRNSDKLAVRERVLALNKQIKEYVSDFSGKYIIYSVQTAAEKPTDLYIYEQSSQKQFYFQLPKRLNVRSIQFSRFGDLYFIGSTPDVDIDFSSESTIPEFPSKIYRYKFSNNELQELDIIKTHYSDTNDFLIAPDGNSLILLKYGFEVVAVSLLDGTTTPIGKYYGFGGFSYKGDKLAMYVINLDQEEFVPLAEVYSGKGVSYRTPNKSYIKDPSLSIKGDTLAISEKLHDLENSEGVYSLRIFDLNNPSVEKTIEPTGGLSYELPQFSPDGNYLSWEVYSEEDLSDLNNRRTNVNPGKPLNSLIEIRDIISSASLQIDQRFNLIWVK